MLPHFSDYLDPYIALIYTVTPPMYLNNINEKVDGSPAIKRKKHIDVTMETTAADLLAMEYGTFLDDFDDKGDVY